MHNEELIIEAFRLYVGQMESFLEDNNNLSILDIRRKHSIAKFEAIDYFIKKCTFEVNPWKLEKEIREKFDMITTRYKRQRKLNMFACGIPQVTSNVSIGPSSK